MTEMTCPYMHRPVGRYTIKPDAVKEWNVQDLLDYIGESTPECVYLIYAPAPVMKIKIGSSMEPVKRFRTLLHTNAAALKYVGECHTGGFPLEKKLHEWFSRWRSHGEWFHVDEDLLDLLDHLDIFTYQRDLITEDINQWLTGR